MGRNRVFPQESFGHQTPPKKNVAQKNSKFHYEKLAAVTGVSKILNYVFVEGVNW
jgi:hypothetical protein